MLRTALYETHRSLGARLIDFGGWEMPVMYRGISEEHGYTRTAASVFDVSHMGRLVFTGPDAEALLQHVCTRNVGKLAVGRSGYSHVCNEQGGILDDVIVSRCEDRWLMVCNAGNREKILSHLRLHAAGRDAAIEDTTLQTVMLAIQGPATMKLFAEYLTKYLPVDPSKLARYGFVTGSAMGQKYTIFRSGYTGEDGVEVVVSAATGGLVWDFLTKESGSGRVAVRPAGLGARDTLRLEAGMPLYGHELSERVDPISAGCGWAVDLNKEFVGAAALRSIAAEGPRRKGTREVGEVTSGTLSPTLVKSIAMAYVDSTTLAVGENLTVEIRDARVAATIVPLPFYKRSC